MNINVVDNAKRNIGFGMASRVVAMLCPFVTRTVVQYTFGEQYLGLGSLFSSVLSMLSLAELGFGSAIVYSMYKPVAEGNDRLVNALLNFYRRVYALTGLVILAIGLLLIPVLPLLIKGGYPSDINLTLVYLIYLGNAVVSYFLYAYMSSLIVVYQRDDINSRTNMIVTIGLAAGQIIMLSVFHSYLLFCLMMPLFTIINNLRIAFVVRRMFPQYHCEGSVPGELLGGMKRQIAGTFISKVCRVARNSLDSICISAFLGLALTGIYNNYYYILYSVTAFMSIFTASLTGGVGNHVVNKSRAENFEELKALDFVYMWVGGWCTVCLLCLYQPFMRLWMRGDEAMLLPNGAVALYCVYSCVKDRGYEVYVHKC